MKRNSVTVYLDSQDYSSLSDTDRHAAEPDLPELLGNLRAFRESGRVRFVFSAVGVAEALPMGVKDVEKARGRVRLIRELCGETTLVNFANISKAELCVAYGLSESVEAYGGKYAWQPDLSRQMGSPSDLNKRPDDVAMEFLRRQKMSEKERQKKRPLLAQAIRAEMLKKRQARIDAGDFSIHPKFNNLLLSLAVGEATLEEKKLAVLESWSDLEWLVQEYEVRPEIVDWYKSMVRDPSANGASGMRRFVTAMNMQDERISVENWRRIGEEILHKNIAAEAEFFGLSAATLTTEEVQKYCPGHYLMHGTLMEYLWDYIGGRAKKTIPDSIWADCMHAMYAPYVDIFRADRMAANYMRRVSGVGATKIVSGRGDLISCIQSSLSEIDG